MDFSPTEDQLAAQQLARDFAQQEVLPKAAAIDREHRHPAELVKRMGELGLLGVAIPDAHGGAGLDRISYVLALEEIARACASTAVIMSVNNSLVCDPIYKFGTRRAAREVAGAARQRQAARLLRAVGARGRQRRRGTEDDRDPEARRQLADSTARRTGSRTARSPTCACCSR